MIRMKLDTKIGEKMRVKMEENVIKMDNIEIKIEKVEEDMKTFHSKPAPI